MRRPNNRKDKLQSSIRSQPNLKPINFCVPGILSKCGAGTTWSGHRHCTFANKSEFSDRYFQYVNFLSNYARTLAPENRKPLRPGDPHPGINFLRQLVQYKKGCYGLPS